MIILHWKTLVLFYFRFIVALPCCEIEKSYLPARAECLQRMYHTCQKGELQYRLIQSNTILGELLALFVPAIKITHSRAVRATETSCWKNKESGQEFHLNSTRKKKESFFIFLILFPVPVVELLVPREGPARHWHHQSVKCHKTQNSPTKLDDSNMEKHT